MSTQIADDSHHPVMSRSRTEYRYIRYGRYSRAKSEYLSLEINPLSLLCKLYWYGKPLGIRLSGARQFLSDCKRLVRMMRLLIVNRWRAPASDDLLVLPISGHYCRQVQKGFKIFDLSRNVAIKLFYPYIKLPMVRRELTRVRRVGEHAFAPTVHSWNALERWYEEEYVDASRLPRPSLAAFLDTFHLSVPPLLVRIVLAFPPEEKRSVQYAEDLLRTKIVKLDELNMSELDSDKVTRIRQFFDQAIDRLRLEGDRLIYLCWSHGDFSTQHVLVAKRLPMPVLIDWERSGYRSVMYDLYDAFFKRLRQVGRADPDMVITMNRAIAQFRSLVTQEASADYQSLIESLESTELYRLIYSIEKICKSIGQNMTHRKLDRIVTYIDIFGDYEQQNLLDKNLEIAGGR